MSKPSLPELPLGALPGASLDLGSAMPPLTPLASLQPPGSGMAPDALPLLVQMPGGETRQVALRPGATVAELRAELNAPEDWVLGFNGEILSGGEELGKYNIPDAYDHAGGLLKMIDTSGLEIGEKVDALEKACAVVQGISRGERDMDRIISAAMSDDVGATDGGSGQPSLRMPRNPRKDPPVGPNLSFSSLMPPGLSQIGLQPPPTPSQLLRRLGTQFPNLYPPKAQDKMEAELKKGIVTPRVMGAAERLAATAEANERAQMGKEENTMLDAKGTDAEDEDSREGKAETEPTPDGEANPDEGSGPLMKRGSTWFEEVMKSLVPGTSGTLAAGRGATKGVAIAKTAPTIGDDAGLSSGEELEPDEDDEDFGASEVESEAPHAKSHATYYHGGSIGTDLSSKRKQNAATTKDRGDVGASEGNGGDCGALPVKVPKKRGRKRKNPELSEDERKALRQAQNRESAKQSRLRRKTQTAEYEQRVTSLCSENETLRDTISALSDRLRFLQGLLTVSVTTQRPVAAPPLPGAAPPVQNPMLMQGLPPVPVPVPMGPVPVAVPPPMQPVLPQMAAIAAAAAVAPSAGNGGLLPSRPQVSRGNFAGTPPGL